MSEKFSTQDYRKQIIEASKKAVEELIKVLNEPIIAEKSKGKEATADKDLSADRLKNAVMAKKMAQQDAFDMLTRIDAEEANLVQAKHGPSKGFAEQFSKRS